VLWGVLFFFDSLKRGGAKRKKREKKICKKKKKLSEKLSEKLKFFGGRWLNPAKPLSAASSPSPSRAAGETWTFSLMRAAGGSVL
jgi:hypothetical protein